MTGGERPLRIAFVGHKCLPANYGGVEVYAEELGARLVAAGHTVISFTAHHDGFAEDGAHHRGVERRAVGRLRGKHAGPLSQAWTSSLAAARADVDVVHYMAMGGSIFIPLVRLFGNAVVVVTIAGRDDQRKKWGHLAKAFMRAAFQASKRLPDAVIVVSNALLDDYRDRARRVVRISNGAPIVRAPRTIKGMPEGPFVLYAGRLVPEKRLEDLIDAFARLPGDTRLVIAGGGGGAKGYVERVHARAAADPRIDFLGHRSRKDVYALMGRAGAFVLPSELEGLPIALLEATAHGTPVVVSDLPCHLEVVGACRPGAQVVPVGDVGALAAALEAVLDGPELARADAARLAVQVRQRFDWDDVARRVEDLYFELLRMGKARERVGETVHSDMGHG